MDNLLREQVPNRPDDVEARLDAILEQMDRIPDLAERFNPLDWDQDGLPR